MGEHEMVTVRREDLEVVKTYYGQLVSAAFWTDDKKKIDRLRDALEEKEPPHDPLP